MSAKDILSQYEPVFLRHSAFALAVLHLLVVRVPGPLPRTLIDITSRPPDGSSKLCGVHRAKLGTEEAEMQKLD